MVPEVQTQGRLDAPSVHSPIKVLEVQDQPGRIPISADLQVKWVEPKLIGLHGRARSGKDTVAKLLSKHHAIQTISFAEPIRNGLRGIMGLTDDHFHGHLKEVEIDWLGKSPRQLMQSLGTEWGRKLVNEEIWLLLALKSIERHLRYGINVVVTDVRFDNEADLIRKIGGNIWHVTRPGPEIAGSNHSSEAGLSRFDANTDFLLLNDGSLDDLEEQAVQLFERSGNE